MSHHTHGRVSNTLCWTEEADTECVVNDGTAFNCIDWHPAIMTGCLWHREVADERDWRELCGVMEIHADWRRDYRNRCIVKTIKFYGQCRGLLYLNYTAINKPIEIFHWNYKLMCKIVLKSLRLFTSPCLRSPWTLRMLYLGRTETFS